MGDIWKILIQNGCRFITHSPTISSQNAVGSTGSSGELRQKSWKTVELFSVLVISLPDGVQIIFSPFFILNQIKMASKTVSNFRFICLFYSASKRLWLFHCNAKGVIEKTNKSELLNRPVRHSEVQLTCSRSIILKIASNQGISLNVLSSEGWVVSI